MCTIICVIIVLGLCACGRKVNESKTHDTFSEIYSKEDITSAIDTIKTEFRRDWSGCTLT